MKQRRSVIGLDLGSHSIKAVQTNASGEPVATAHVPRPEPGIPLDAADFDRLQGVLYRHGFAGSRAAICAPKDIIHRLTIDLPPVDSGAPLDQIARTELCRQRGLSPDAFEFTWNETPQPPRHASGARAVAQSCTHEDANRVLDLCESIGLRPVTLQSPALVAGSLAKSATGGRSSAVIDLGGEDATFVSVRDGKARFVRAVPGAGLAAVVGSEDWLSDSLGKAIRNTVRTGDPSPLRESGFEGCLKRYRAAVCAEIASSIDYLGSCGSDEEPITVTIVGGGSVIPGLRSDLAGSIRPRVIEPENAPHPGFAFASALAGTASAVTGEPDAWEDAADGEPEPTGSEHEPIPADSEREAA